MVVVVVSSCGSGRSRIISGRITSSDGSSCCSSRSCSRGDSCTGSVVEVVVMLVVVV